MNSAGTKYEMIVTTPSDREVAMTRVFDAPAAMVFDAFTKPELIRRWLLGPEGWSMPVCDVDLKVGGKFHYEWRNDADGKQFGLKGEFRDIARPERIVHVEKFDESWQPGDATVTTTFVDKNGSTTVTLTCLYDSLEIRDSAIECGMAKGVAASFDRLAEILK